MAVGGINKAEGVRAEQVRTEQRKTEESRAEEQKRANQNNREVSEAPKAADKGRGENVDLTA